MRKNEKKFIDLINNSDIEKIPFNKNLYNRNIIKEKKIHNHWYLRIFIPISISLVLILAFQMMNFKKSNQTIITIPPKLDSPQTPGQVPPLNSDPGENPSSPNKTSEFDSLESYFAISNEYKPIFEQNNSVGDNVTIMLDIIINNIYNNYYDNNTDQVTKIKENHLKFIELLNFSVINETFDKTTIDYNDLNLEEIINESSLQKPNDISDIYQLILEYINDNLS